MENDDFTEINLTDIGKHIISNITITVKGKNEQVIVLTKEDLTSESLKSESLKSESLKNKPSPIDDEYTKISNEILKRKNFQGYSNCIGQPPDIDNNNK